MALLYSFLHDYLFGFSEDYAMCLNLFSSPFVRVDSGLLGISVPLLECWV